MPNLGSLTTDVVDESVRRRLSAALRQLDDAIVLPGASVSAESGALKNVVLLLNGGGKDGKLPPDLFSSNWFSGVAMVRLPAGQAERWLDRPGGRDEALRALASAIPSELASIDVQVGPELDCDEEELDTSNWTAGLDGPGSCVGLYSSDECRQPQRGWDGTSRVYRTHYLVCKAGSGMAGQTFHARLTQALQDGATLDEALGPDGEVGFAALRRVAGAARRNRARILVAAARALDMLMAIDTVGDTCALGGGACRLAVPHVEAVYNSLTPYAAGASEYRRSKWRYASGCVDAAASQGCVVSSNVAEGFVAFFGGGGGTDGGGGGSGGGGADGSGGGDDGAGSEGDMRLAVRNDAENCTPFASLRRITNREAMLAAVDAWTGSIKSGASASASDARARAHPDGRWIRGHFAWQGAGAADAADVEPPGLWGTHHPECVIAPWSRELGLAHAQCVRVRPEAVCLAAMEPSKRRIAQRAIKGARPQ